MVLPKKPMNGKVGAIVDKLKGTAQQRKAAGNVSAVNRHGQRFPTPRGNKKFGEFATSVLDKMKQKRAVPAFKKGGKVGSTRKK